MSRAILPNNELDRVFVPKNEGKKYQKNRSEILVVIAWSHTIFFGIPK